MKGARGPPGERGYPGEQGDQGNPGLPGVAGLPVSILRRCTHAPTQLHNNCLIKPFPCNRARTESWDLQVLPV